MKLFSWLKRTEKKQYPDGHDFWYSDIMGFLGGNNMVLDEPGALRFLTVYACVRIISGTMGAIPLILYRRLFRGKEKAENHNLYRIMRYLPNPDMNAMTFKSILQGHLLTWGNAYCLKEYSNDGNIKAVWPLLPNKMNVKKEDGKRIYQYSTNKNGLIEIPNENILHIPGFGFDGLVGYSPVSIAQRTIMTGLQMDAFNQNFYKNGARPSGILAHPGKLSPESKKDIRENIAKVVSGDKLFSLLLLDEGMDLKQFNMPMTDAQFIETRRFTQSQIAGELYGVPLHKLGNLERATFSNIEEQNIEFHIDTMLPWFTLWELEAYRSLLTEDEKNEYFFEFKTDALLRGDIRSRYQAYAIGRQNGWLSANDIREKENENPLPGDQGDIYTIPTNTIPADKIDDFYGNKNKSEGDKNAGKK